MPTLSFLDPRHADTYVIELDDDGDFMSCLRYLPASPRDPISYDHLADVPLPHRDTIEQMISRRQNYK